MTLGFGIAALLAQSAADTAAQDSAHHYLSDVESELHHARVYGAITAGAGAVMIGTGVVTAVLLMGDRDEAQVVPVAGAGHAGLAVVGRF